MAVEYCSTPARSLQLVLPPKGKPRTEPWAVRTGAPIDGETLTDNQRALLVALPMRATAAAGAAAPGGARARRARDRQRRRAPRTDVQPSPPVELTADQAAAIAGGRARRRAPAARRHRLGQDEVYLRAAAGGAGARRGRDRARCRRSR
jgi:hypothetical protein